jgi:hypothetical protein
MPTFTIKVSNGDRSGFLDKPWVAWVDDENGEPVFDAAADGETFQAALANLIYEEGLGKKTAGRPSAKKIAKKLVHRAPWDWEVYSPNREQVEELIVDAVRRARS